MLSHGKCICSSSFMYTVTSWKNLVSRCPIMLYCYSQRFVNICDAPVIINYEVKHFVCVKMHTLWNQPFHTPEVTDFCHIKYISENSHDVEKVGLSMSVTFSCELLGTAKQSNSTLYLLQMNIMCRKTYFLLFFFLNEIQFSFPFIYHFLEYLKWPIHPWLIFLLQF